MSMTALMFSQTRNTATPKVMFEVLGPSKSHLYVVAGRFRLDLGGFIKVSEGVEARESDNLCRPVATCGGLWRTFTAESGPFKKIVCEPEGLQASSHEAWSAGRLAG